MNRKYRWRVLKLESGWYKVQQSNYYVDDWFDLHNYSPLSVFLHNGYEGYHMFLYFCKRKVDRLVKEQERKAAQAAEQPKVVYGPYP